MVQDSYDRRAISRGSFSRSLAKPAGHVPVPIATDAQVAAPKGTYAFVSLGCPKNLVDSERMLGLLRQTGYRLVAEPAGADFVVINTCGFIAPARAESLGAIDEMLQLKADGQLGGVIVAGCLAERDRAELLAQRPEIDALVGVFAREEIVGVADRLIGNVREQRTLFCPAPIRSLPDGDRLRITPRHFAYLKISEGCDRHCTFCAIPKLRGNHVTKPLEQVLQEAQQLADGGVRELILVAQDTPYYGIDLYGAPRLRELLEPLERIEGLDWIRLMYFYPRHVDPKLIETLADSGKILPYLDMPLQHINDTVLRRMGRQVSRRETETLLAQLRSRIPGLALRTTMLVGFPGETEEQFEELLEFVCQQQFHRLGVFAYSREPGTASDRMKGHVPAQVSEERRRRLMEAQQQIAFARNADQVGRVQRVILDWPVPGEQNVWVGRSEADAPDVDAAVYVTGTEDPLCAGDIVPCEIVAWRDYDLIGVAVGEPI